jgi:uncharacterized protein YciI
MLKKGPTEEEVDILTRHFSYLKDLTDRGTVLLAGRTQNQDEWTFGIVILQIESEESAMQLMKNDPAVRHKVMRAELFPFKTALHGKVWDAAT